MEIIHEPSSGASAESDGDLLEMISWKGEIEIRNAAFTEFHKRYKGFLFPLIEMICSRFPNSYEMSRAIFNNVLCNVYDYSSSFKEEATRKNIEAWLVGIAKTEMKALLTNYKKPIAEEQIVFKKMMIGSVNKGKGISYNEEIVTKAIALLHNQRDQHIFLTYWLYYEKGEGSQAKNLPPDVLNELSMRYDTTEVNIRQIISRSKKIVKKFLEENYKP